ncbi:MAG: TraR/DksA family transcriptional regulator [Gammaproteobacteria bacterium]|nr:TraR/DksA family transcriptional regulator [Gammaproteobacteria bacterium]
MASSLTSKQINTFKKQLEQRLGVLGDAVREELANSDNERYQELAGAVPDEGDQSIADLLADVNLAVIDQHINEIRRIEEALGRIRSGAYGVCIDCGEDIARKRLEAYPPAARCHDCQARYERSYAQTGTPRL